MPVFDHYMPQSEQGNYAKGGCMSVLVLLALGGAFVGSIYLAVWLFG